MEQKRKWRKRQQTRAIDYWVCPWCGERHDDLSAILDHADVAGYGAFEIETCKKCGKKSSVTGYISWELVAEPHTDEE